MPQDLTDDKSTLVQVWLGAVRQQAITWAIVDPDLCRHMASLGHNELNSWFMFGAVTAGMQYANIILF